MLKRKKQQERKESHEKRYLAVFMTAALAQLSSDTATEIDVNGDGELEKVEISSEYDLFDELPYVG